MPQVKKYANADERIKAFRERERLKKLEAERVERERQPRLYAERMREQEAKSDVPRLAWKLFALDNEREPHDWQEVRDWMNRAVFAEATLRFEKVTRFEAGMPF